MNKTTLLFTLGLILLTSCKSDQSYSSLPIGSGQNWAVYGGDHASSQYSHLSQITTENVSQLELAWSYSSGDKDEKNRSQIQCNPLIIDGILYGSSPKLKFFALDAATGEEIWSYDPFAGEYNSYGMGVNRGVVHWSNGIENRILFTAASNLYSVDAKTGTLDPNFGENGTVSLHKGLGEWAQELYVVSNTPGIVYNDFLILGTRVSEGEEAAPGYVRAFNIQTGELAWVFHTIPQPGEFGHETWPEDAWKDAGGANAWSGFSLDYERGWVFIPTGSASYDFYGGNRHGENLFANSILALNAETGERIWHYQTVHHDLWDRDLPCAPNLLTVTHNGEKIDAVAQVTKSGFVFVLDRETGKPLFPVEEKSFPASDLPGEEAWPTQPIPVKPPPFARQMLTKEDIGDINPETQANAQKRLEGVKSNGQYIPPSREGTIIFPGYDGGGEWGGAAVDPNSSILYINSSEMPWILTMVPVTSEDDGKLATKGKNLYMSACASCHGGDRKGGSFMGTIPSLLGIKDRLSDAEITKTITKGKGQMPAFGFLADEQLAAIKAFLFDSEELLETKEVTSETIAIPFVSTGYHRFVGEDGNPVTTPPWGRLNAIDLNKGEILWQVPLGEIEELTAKGIPPTGTENYGGPAVTAGGLIFIAASKDEKFRAFDQKTGKILWETKLPAAGYSTPSIYEIDGKQFVVIAAGGGKIGTPSGDQYLAFSLP